MSETRLNVCDLNAIETRVAAWLAQANSLMEVFRPRVGPDGKWRKNGNDPYLDFASKMYSIPYEDMYFDLKIGKDKEKAGIVKGYRQVAKPGVLGAVYRLGGGEMGESPDGYIDHIDDCSRGKFCGCPKIYDKVKTGLWGYAEAMGVSMSMDQAHAVVKMFREAYPEIPAFWTELEDKTREVLDPNARNVVRFVGPNNAVEMNRLNVTMNGVEQFIFRMKLPSGRYLHYLDARIEQKLMRWKNSRTGEDVYKPSMFYAGQNQKTKKWGVVDTHGGKEFENLVQAIARDVLAVKLLMFEAAEMPVVGHVHDEGISIVPADPFSPGVSLMEDIMAEPVEWAPGLLLGADGFEDSFYHK